MRFQADVNTIGQTVHVVRKVLYSKSSTSSLSALLEQHIDKTVVLVDDQWYLQNQGIAQVRRCCCVPELLTGHTPGIIHG
jgi:hypothetical protein